MPTTPNLTPAQAAAAKLASLSPQMRGVLSSMPPAAPAAPMPAKDAVTPGSMLRKPMPAAGRPGMANQGMRPGMRPFAKGGAVSSASKRADGIATKGKTKGKMVKMMGGGKC
jgi:hypothetical protein